MSTTYVIIEDTPDNFQAIVEIITEIDPGAIIFPNNEDLEIKNFRIAYLDFLLNPEGKIEIDRLKGFIPDMEPEYFIVDFSLLNYDSRKIDNWGGVLRQKFIKKYFPKTKVIFFSVYEKSMIIPFMEPTDQYLSKLIPNFTADFKKSWKKSLSFYLRKPD